MIESKLHMNLQRVHCKSGDTVVYSPRNLITESVPRTELLVLLLIRDTVSGRYFRRGMTAYIFTASPRRRHS